MGNDKMFDAERGTRVVRLKLVRAAEMLADIPANGYGILASPGDAEGRIAGAMQLLQEALREIGSTKWPSNADYDRI